MNQSEPARSSVGRPAGQDSDKVRANLLQAARSHFLSREFKAVSIRQIAETAGVNGAMVNYYFGSKQGLYLAMVDDLLESLEQTLQGLSGEGQLTVADFSNSYCRLLAENPWWPNFLVREVLFSQGEIHQAVLKKFSVTLAPSVMQSIQREIATGHYRQNLDPRLTMVSLLGMTVMPFLAKPILENVLGLKIDASLVDTLAQHNTSLFLQGVEASATTEQGRGISEQGKESRRANNEQEGGAA
jgi:TetR/AcrR family transcriptional regulator